MIYIIAIICVFGIAVGQILFKLAAASLQNTGSLFDLNTISILIIAFSLYGLTSILWVWVLQKIELGRVYPFMALAFVFVPIGSYLFFGERFQSQYFLGMFMILAGIFIIIKS